MVVKGGTTMIRHLIEKGKELLSSFEGYDDMTGELRVVTKITFEGDSCILEHVHFLSKSDPQYLSFPITPNARDFLETFPDIVIAFDKENPESIDLIRKLLNTSDDFEFSLLYGEMIKELEKYIWEQIWLW